MADPSPEEGEQKECPWCDGMLLFQPSAHTIFHSDPTCLGFAAFAQSSGGQRASDRDRSARLVRKKEPPQ